MDDLRMLRDLGRELEHQPPPTLVRQRERLLQARSRRRRVSWLMTGLVAVATAAVVGVPTLVLRDHQTLAKPAAGPPPSGALNVLLVGTDGLAGAERFRAQKGVRSDTILLMHLSADRNSVTGVNLPRDSMVRIPACGSKPAHRDMLNSAYSAGGISCTVKAVESLTDVRVDHTLELDFSAVKELVDALGGVEINVPEPVDDKAAKLKLPAGKVMLNGETALGWVRLRRYGDGSDIARIRRQQQLMMAMLKKAQEGLNSPQKLRQFLTLATRSVKADKGLDVNTMVAIAATLGKSKVSFVTVPWQPDPENMNKIVWKQPAADQLFAQLR